MNLDISFGETIKKLRENRQLPLREVADALNIDTSMLGKIEKNSRKPTKQLIGKIAKFFNVNHKDLLITFLSDTVAYQVMDEEDSAIKVLKVAEKKVKYLKTKKTS
jgi:HTH-type transcriptional regulator, competence development regulator